MMHHRRISRRRRMVVAAAAVTLILIPPPRAEAQGSVVFEGFAARRQGESEPLFGGLAISSFSGPIGLRLGGGVHLREDTPPAIECAVAPCPQESSGSLKLHAWTADVDFVLEPFRPVGAARALLLGFSPYAFAGIGGRGVVLRDAPDTTVATASVGAGVHHQLFGRLSVGFEGRYRRALRSDSALTIGKRRDIEYRLGLGFHFGGRHPMTSAGALAVADAESCGSDCSSRAVERKVFSERVASRVLDRADGMVGRKHDAFGFVQSVFHEEGVNLPSSPGKLLSAGTPVPTTAGSLHPGDLVFFAADKTTVDHVAIYAGEDRVVHAINGHVRYDRLGEGARGVWLAEHMLVARRVITGDEIRLRGIKLF